MVDLFLIFCVGGDSENMMYRFDYRASMIKEILSAVNNGLAQAKESADQTEDFDNGVGMEKYRRIYQNMRNASVDGIIPIKFNVNSWKYTGYYHIETSTLFGLISKLNFESKSKQLSNPLYYMAAKSEFFNVIQNDFEHNLSESQKSELQLSLNLEVDSEIDKVVHSIFKNSELDRNNVEKFVLLVFDFVGYEVVDLQAKVINGNFDILYSEDWSHHIIISTQDENDFERKQQESPQHSMKLNLRKGILPPKTNDDKEE